MNNNVGLLKFWSDLLIRPKYFFSRYLSSNEEPPFRLLAWILYTSFAVLLGIGVIYYKIYIDPKSNIENDLQQVIPLIFGQIIERIFQILLSYWVGNWIIAKLLTWLGASENITPSQIRKIKLYEGALFNFVCILYLFIVGYFLRNIYLLTNSSTIFLVLFLFCAAGSIFFLYTYYIFYCGVTTLSIVKKGRLKLLVGLYILPMILMLGFILGLLIALYIEPQLLDKILPNGIALKDLLKRVTEYKPMS